MTKYLKQGHGQDLGLNFKILNPFRKFGTGKARNFKFGTRIDLRKSHLNCDKIPLKGAWSGSRTKILNFKPSSINLEQVKLETSNLMYR